jgi:hypothetical protein
LVDITCKELEKDASERRRELACTRIVAIVF